MSKPRPLPKLGKLPFLSRKSTTDLFVSLFGPVSLLLTGIGALLTAELAKTFLPKTLIVLGIANFIVVVLNWRNAKGQEDEEASNGWLVAACRIIEIGIAQAYEAIHGIDPDVCVASYVPQGKTALAQVAEMGGTEEQPKRIIPKGCGAVGMAAKTKFPQVGSRTNPDIAAFRAQLRSQYNLPLSIVNTVRENMWSWVAVPILTHDGKRILMVVFIDTDKDDCFKVSDLATPGNPTGISAVAMRFCSGIADHFVEYQ